MNDENDLRKQLQDAGFANINIENVAIDGVSSSALNIAKGFVLGTPMYNHLIKVDTTAPEKLGTASEMKLKKMYGDGEVKSKLYAWVCQAWK